MSNIFSFFGQEIKTGAPQAFEIPFGEVILHLSTVSLAKDTPKGSITRVFVHSVDEDDKETKYVICTLVGKEKESVSIDLNFSEDVALSIETSANDDTTVHVTGYINLINEDGEEGEFGGYSVIDGDNIEDESDEEEKTKLLRKMLEEDDDEDDEDFKPDLNESSESAKLEELSDEDEVEGLVGEDDEEIDLDDDQTEEVVKRVQNLENRLGREANDEEIKDIVTRVQAGQPEPAAPKKEAKKEQPKKEAKQPQQKQQQPPKQDNKRKQEEALGNNKNKKNKKNKKK